MNGWAEGAACRETDPELFFPEQGDKYAAADVRGVCGDCPVREACLEWALDHGVEYGIWGGQTWHERKALRAERRRSKKIAA